MKYFTLRKYIVQQVNSPKEGEIDEILALFEEKHFQKGGLFKKKPFTIRCFKRN